MLTPTVANRFSFFYAAGNTPATSLTRYVPNDVDANILSLGCGDLRQVFYTAYMERSTSSRRLNITCCDIDEKVIGRNILFLSFLVDDEKSSTDEFLFTSYYDVLVDKQTADLVRKQAEKLLPLLSSLISWKKSKYGRVLKFCDSGTLDDTRKIFNRIVDGAKNPESMQQNLAASQSFQKMQVGDNTVLTGMRSAAPMAIGSMDEMPRAYEKYWSTGKTSSQSKDAKVPNPTIAAILSDDSLLHYGTDPLMVFHLATAYAPLRDSSPLKPAAGAEEIQATMAAKTQFKEWVKALKRILKGKMTLTFSVCDVYALCHTFQHFAATGNYHANWFRRQWDARILEIDADYYQGNPGAVEFDAIDTSNLADHFGTLNILISASPLLKEQPWATVCTEILIKTEDSQKSVIDNILCGNTATMSLLLGVSPIQYWTNAKVESHVDEVMLELIHGATSGSSPAKVQMHSRVAWKRGWHLAGANDSRRKLHMTPEGLSKIIFEAYSRMFENENLSAGLSALATLKASYSHFHRGTFAAFLKFLKQRVATDWDAVIVQILDKIQNDTSVSLSSNYMQEINSQLHLHGVFTSPSLLNSNSGDATGILAGWKTIPPVVAVTLVVPKGAAARLFLSDKKSQMVAPTVLGSLKAAPKASNQWHNMFGEVQIVFGNVKRPESTSVESSRIEIEQDRQGWLGTSPLIATFYVPAAALQMDPDQVLIGLSVAGTGQSAAHYYSVLGPSLTVFEAKLASTNDVFISKFMPSQSGYVEYCGKSETLADATTDEYLQATRKLSADVLDNFPRVKTVTGRVDIGSTKGRDLLQKGTEIGLRQKSSFEVEIVLGKAILVYPLSFPVPVTKEKSRTRIARKSGYIEVISPIADPIDSDCLQDYLFPATLSTTKVPVALNTPHLNLDHLPILDLQQRSKMKWLTTHTSLQFSSREKKLREGQVKNKIAKELRVNFKESIFTMFMLTSGLHGDQTGLFAISNPERGGVEMLVIVSAMLLDADTASVVLDAAIIPLTKEMIHSPFMLMLRDLEICTVVANDQELEAWKKVIPSYVERCRTWTHKPDCEYRKRGATIPLSLGFGEPVLCSCGNGKFPENYLNIPLWAEGALYATRVAISPAFAVPFVEEVVDRSTFDASAGASYTTGDGCRVCGRTEAVGGGDLKRCTRCYAVKYCSKECQKRDWRTHREECEEVDD